MDFSLEKLGELKKLFGQYGYQDVYFISDLVVLPILIFIIHIFLRWRRTKQPAELQKYFLSGYYFRYFGLAIFLLYHLILTSSRSDSLTYFWASNDVFQILKTDPGLAWDIIFSSVEETKQMPASKYLSQFLFTDGENLIVKIIAFVGFFTGSSYFGNCIVLGVFAFAGCWKIFKTFYRLYPKAVKQLALACLFVPSVAVWSSAVSKEIVCIGALGYFTSAFAGIFIFKEKKVINWILLFSMAFLLAKIKVYILIGLLAAILFFFIIRILKMVRSPFLKIILVPVLVVIFTGLGIISFSVLGSKLTFFSPEKILETAVTTYAYLSQEGFAASRYDLGTIEPTLPGIAKVAPAGLVVTLFRPWLWEANRPIALLSAIESLILIGLLFYVLFQTGFLRSFRIIFSDPIITFSFVFVIIFSIAVGLTSGNFGTLVRYKIPMLPFFFSILAILYSLRVRPQVDAPKQL